MSGVQKRTPFMNSLSPLTSAILLSMALTLPVRAEQPNVDFERTVAPILVKNCLNCHNASEPKGNLDLTRQETVAKGGKTKAALVPGKASESFLIRRVTEGSMPPKKGGRRLTEDEVASLSAWIDAGAKWPENRVLSPFEFTTEHRAGLDWWAFQPVARPQAPAVKDREWVRSPIDAFIRAKLEVRKIARAPPADKATLLRRAKYDLLGLPPTPDEIDAFLADDSADAYEKLLDRLLASPHYGERWGRHWLDVVRFGESDGFENDKLREHAWPYRDYVIRSFNDDKPYAQFVKEQLAGDVLQPLTRDGLLGTGFLVAGPWDEVQFVGKSKLERMRTHEEQVEEMLGAVGQTFLGLTVNCARCHDHKFDPIPQRDYYRLKAVFDGVDHGNRSIFTPEEQKAHDAVVAPIQKRLSELRADFDELRNQLPADALADKLDDKMLVDGRFGKALDARRASASADSKAAFRKLPFTVECWAKLDGKTGFNILVANNLKESGEHWEIYSYAGSGEFSAYLPGYDPAEIKSGVEITDGKWHYLAMILDGEKVRLYVDAKLVKEITVTRRQPAGALGKLSFGAYLPQKIGCAGLLDEVRLSNGVRKIDSVPDAPFAADEETIGLWHFDKADGNIFRDAAALNRPDLEKHKQKQSALLAELKQQEAELAKHPIPQAYVGIRRQPELTVVLLRGDLKTPGAPVTAGALSPIRRPSPEMGLAADTLEGERRLKFAEWVVHPDNPLTARVMVNRIWQYHFGHGLIATPSDFGFHAEQPSHPELLDWLAREFVAGGGSVKAMHRLIMLSATYRQSSKFNSNAAQFDADNRLLWRFPPRRLEAEIVRDAMLAVSGELNEQVGGPSFRPFTVTVFNTHFYHLFDSDLPEFKRRSVYRIGVNTARDPMLETLDCPAPSITMPKRPNTTTALQALALMNDSFVQRQAARFAKRVKMHAGDDRDKQITLVYRFALARPPTDEERTATAKLIDEHGLDAACWVLLNASEFLYTK
jgi:hypothetical protein